MTSNAPSEHVFTTPATTQPIHFNQVHALPVSSSSPALPGNIHTCTWVPSSIPFGFMLLNKLFTTLFQQAGIINTSCVFSSFLFPQSHFESASHLPLLSNQIMSHFSSVCKLFINPIYTSATVMIISRLKSAGNEREQSLCCCVSILCVCSVVQQLSHL